MGYGWTGGRHNTWFLCGVSEGIIVAHVDGTSVGAIVGTNDGSTEGDYLNTTSS